MYFSRFRKYSPGREQYGRGFVLYFKNISIILGFKKTRTILGFNKLTIHNHYGRYKRYIFNICMFFLNIILEIRITNKTELNLFKNLLRKKKKLLH